ncbi:MAG: hypothetical protein OEY52_10305 [Gammaproteobacteria bacterium]|nr:hypothetical protein [Gammaproteobacteria bacterium]
MKLLLSIFTVILFASCSSKDENSGYKSNKIASLISEEGHEAYIIESTFNKISDTQLLIKFNGGKCSSGAVYGEKTDLGLKMRWKQSVLVVSKPENVVLSRNPSGEYIKCGKYTIQVAIENYE